MRIQDIKIGEQYRHKDHPLYGWAKVIEKIPPHTGVNTHGYTILKCEYVIGKNDMPWLFRYFKASNLVQPE